MISISGLLFQLRSLLPSIIIVSIVSFAVLGSVYAFHWYENIPLKTLTGDVTMLSKAPIYTGFLSQLGIFFWAASISICFLSTQLVVDPSYKNFFLVSGLISLLLGLDDLFLFHEVVFPSLGIHQKLVFLGYALMMLVYGIKFYKILLNTDYILFALAIGFFGISLLVDNFFYEASPFVTEFIEDGGKFIGILFWMMYYYTTGFKRIINLR